LVTLGTKARDGVGVWSVSSATSVPTLPTGGGWEVLFVKAHVGHNGLVDGWTDGWTGFTSSMFALTLASCAHAQKWRRWGPPTTYEENNTTSTLYGKKNKLLTILCSVKHGSEKEHAIGWKEK
jgi:hypothetical protein